MIALHSTRRRQLIWMLMLSIALPGTTLFRAAADDLKHRGRVVERRLDKAGDQLDQSSAGVLEAIRRLRVAESRLRAARGVLSQRQGELVAARAVDVTMAARLRAADEALASAANDEEAVRRRAHAMEANLRQVAIQTYQEGDPKMVGLSLMLTTQRPADLAVQLGAVQSVLDKGTATVQRLQATEVVLSMKVREVAAAKEAVAEERAAARRTVVRRRSVEVQASRAAEVVRGLVAARARRVREASQARAEDRNQLRALKLERRQVSVLLKRRAKAAHRRAAALADLDQQPLPTKTSDDLRWPVVGRISSPFGMRFHPVYRRWSLHDGLDIAAPCGTPVRAAAAGRVLATYFNSAYGNRIVMDNGLQRRAALGTTYNHLSAFATATGQWVQQGAVIGYVGATGASTGCHLHFMVLRVGRAVDPRLWL